MARSLEPRPWCGGSIPQHGLLPPGEFLPLAEETGLILPLGEWVLQSACTQIAAWERDKGIRNIPVAVNISGKQLRQSDFVEQMLAYVEHWREPCEPQARTYRKLRCGRYRGSHHKNDGAQSPRDPVLPDDFGTGYSSLAGLKRLPLDQLKIDRSFVQGILDDAASSAIAQAIIFMGNNMNLSVIAEGVEAPNIVTRSRRLAANPSRATFSALPCPRKNLRAFGWTASELPESSRRPQPPRPPMDPELHPQP